uniref:DUF927 domain-containing protein n=1 Tax=Steinernema glaseri TaxID=37863 RepID=A0A1I7ZD33_9BILA
MTSEGLAIYLITQPVSRSLWREAKHLRLGHILLLRSSGAKEHRFSQSAEIDASWICTIRSPNAQGGSWEDLESWKSGSFLETDSTSLVALVTTPIMDQRRDFKKKYILLRSNGISRGFSLYVTPVALNSRLLCRFRVPLKVDQYQLFNLLMCLD